MGEHGVQRFAVFHSNENGEPPSLIWKKKKSTHFFGRQIGDRR